MPVEEDVPVGALTHLTALAETSVYRSALTMALVPPGVVTRTGYTQGLSAGDVAVIFVGDATVKLLAETEPNVTRVVPANPLPVIVTDVPPVAGPEVGEIPVTVGAGATVNWSPLLAGLVPPAVVTLTPTVPTACAGDTAVIVVADATVKLVAATVPNCTFVAAVKAVPVTVTTVPPAVGPDVGAIPVTAGTAA